MLVVPPVLEVSGLTKRFGDVVAVDDISFAIGDATTVGLVGPNGAGKTTTIHMILALITPTAGSVRILGRDPHRDRSALGDVNFSATYVSLPQTLTVEENLNVFARLYEVPRPKHRVAEVLERLGIPSFAKRQSRALSSGQSTMVHIAKALLNRPRLLLLDEPTASLDPDTADRARVVLLEIAREEGMTLLITSHNMAELTQMCDRIIFIHHGRIIADDTPTELVKRYGAEDLTDLFIRVARGGA
jgi:ABC-2 type transport system ATP-binding protein